MLTLEVRVATIPKWREISEPAEVLIAPNSQIEIETYISDATGKPSLNSWL